jgi:hypothetical protein
LLPLWLVVSKGYATRRELATEWDYEDLQQALAVIQMEADIMAAMMPKTPPT